MLNFFSPARTEKVMCPQLGVEKDLAPELIGLLRHAWPGNVRELRGALKYALVTCHTTLVHPNHLPETIVKRQKPPPPVKRTGINLWEIERQELLETLEESNGNQSRVAKKIGISRVTLWNRMKRFNIQIQRMDTISSS